MKQRYDSYKPSGIDWIGDIPSHWNIRKTSQLFQGIGSGTTPTSGSNKYYCENGINWLQTGDLNDGQIIETSKKLTELAIKDFSSLRLYPKASIVIAMYGATIGKLGILNIQTTTNQACCVLPYSKGINPNFGFYAYRAGKQSLINSAYGGGQPNISQETIKSFRIALPPLAEQEAIAAWLDTQCEEIDAAIAKVDREIELIDELKQSEISRVVTRGLNPDTPLRPSGIDWIGDIPKHWIICKVKHLVKFNSGDTITSEQFIDNAEFPVYGANGYRGQFDKYNFENQRILIGRVGALCGNVHYTNEKIWCSEHALISSKAFGGLSFDYKWMCLLFESMNLNQYGGGSAQPVIASSVIENLSIILPPLSEQQAIADYLDKKCAEIDGLKAKLIKKRETLTELRQSIISEVVTGKRKVI